MSILKNQSRLILIFLMIFLGIDCDDKKEKNPEPEIIISVFPDIGTTETEFVFTVEYLIIDGDTVKDFSSYQVRWDLDNDGIWESDWLDTLSISTSYSTYGKHVIKTELHDLDEIIYTATYRAFVQELLQITENASTSSQMNPDWCPDGTNRIAFEWRPDPGEHRIYIVQYPNGIPEPVTTEPAHFAEWSPDGQHILFERNDGFWIVNLDNMIEIEIIPKEDHPWDFVRWSPDGNWMLFNGKMDTDLSLIAYNFIDYTYISISDQQYDHFCWSPTGDRIAYTHNMDFLNISSFPDWESIKEYPIAHKGTKYDWSPDGEWISLGFFQGEILFLINVNNGRILTLKPDGIDYLWYSGWSSDGSLIAFEGKHENESHLSIWAITFPDDI